MSKQNAIILLSGGLDSVVSTAVAVEKFNIKKALHFNYGQKPHKQEYEAFNRVCKHYKLSGEVIDLGWLAAISSASALSESNSTSSDIGVKYWIPNRNGLFVNIGACYAEALGCEVVILGANKEEAAGFKDNTEEFIEASTNLFNLSTQNNVKLYAPLIDMDKAQIVKTAIELGAPLEAVWSCYNNSEKNCGTCPSCRLLKQALEDNNRLDLQKVLF